MTRYAVFLTLAIALSGCGLRESRLNPFNWFGSGADAETAQPMEIQVRQDTRPLVAQITDLVVERTPGGAIVRVTALPPEQGWYDAGLVAETGDTPVDGVIAYSFRARPPAAPTRVSTVQSRELVAAVFISDIALATARQIRVTGALNSRTARR